MAAELYREVGRDSNTLRPRFPGFVICLPFRCCSIGGARPFRAHVTQGTFHTPPTSCGAGSATGIGFLPTVRAYAFAKLHEHPQEDDSVSVPELKIRALTLSSALVLAACGGGGDGGGTSDPPAPPGPNTAPTISGQPAASVNEGESYQFLPTANDAEGDALTFSIRNKPNWATFDADTGRLAGTPASDDVGLQEDIVISVSDGRAQTSLAPFSLVVVAADLGPNDPPDSTIVRPVADIVINAGQAVSFTGAGTDSDGHVPLTFEWDFGDATIADASGADPAPVVYGKAGTYIVKVAAIDARGAKDPTPAEIRVEVRAADTVVLPQSGWKLVRVDSEETTVPAEPGQGTNAFDGDANTFWHTRWAVGSAAPRPPHEIEINLGASYELEGFRYLPRQDQNAAGQIAEYAFYVSQDGENWGAEQAHGIFNTDKSEKEVRFAVPVQGQFIRLVALSEINGGPWTSVAELKMLGRAAPSNEAPESTITAPVDNVVVGVGQQVSFSGSGDDPDGSRAGLGYRWDFGASGVPVSNVASSGAVTFEQAGTYVVTFTAADEQGRVDPTPARRVVKVMEAGGDPRLSKSAWRIHYVDSEKASSPAALAASAIDGNNETAWRTTANANGERLPHELQIDLGELIDVDALRYLPPQEGERGGRVTDYEIFLSEDAQFWGLPVATGTFADTAGEKRVLFAPRRAQFVRFVARGAAIGSSAAAAELDLEGRKAACDDPFVRLLEPKRNAVQPEQLAVRLSVCLDPRRHAGWKAQVLVDGQQKATLEGAPWSTTMAGLTADNHTVKVQLVDAAGAVVGAAQASDEVVNVGIGDYYVALGDSITNGFGDTDAADNRSSDGRNETPGYTPILNNLLTAAKGYPHTVVNEGINGATTFNGMEKMPVLLARHPRANIVLIGFGTNDNGRTPRPSGLGKNPGDTGYAGSYKANMQAMVDMATAAGKQVYFQKVPYPGRTVALVEDYNRVIDELVTENGLRVTPPDLYTYFEGTYTTEYFDNVHPNGVGYRAMANLWKEALAP